MSRVQIYPWRDDKNGMKMHHSSVQKEENNTLRFRSFKTIDDIQMLVARTPDNQALGQCELHTVVDVRRNGKYLRPIKYCSPGIVKRMRLFVTSSVI